MTAPQGTCAYFVYQIVDTYDLAQILNSSVAGNQIGAQVAKNCRIYIDDCDQSLAITNADSALCNLRIYEYIARRDVPASLTSTGNVVNNGFNYQTSTVSPIQASSEVGTLYNNPLFCAYYKITSMRTVELAGGRTLDLSQSIRTGKRLNPVIEDVNNILTIPHYTRGFVIQVVGQPVNGTSLQSGMASSAPCKLDVLQYRRYKYNQPVSSLGNTYMTSNIPLLSVISELDPATGAPDVNQQA
jgi:hypothetical protein